MLPLDDALNLDFKRVYRRVCFGHGRNLLLVHDTRVLGQVLAELGKEDLATTVLVDGCEEFFDRIDGEQACVLLHLLEMDSSVAIRVDGIEEGPEVVVVHDVLQEIHEFGLADEAVAGCVAGFVGPHDGCLVVEVGVHGDDGLVKFCQRQFARRVLIELVELLHRLALFRQCDLCDGLGLGSRLFDVFRLVGSLCSIIVDIGVVVVVLQDVV
mmetsp:Transcript_448/g.1250  ORF Transcript_448/g.1250 Transcript_448/m.1250 type:complete len:212 (-) Transcript_448:268-903(-)